MRGGGFHRRGNYIHICTHGDNNCEAVFAGMWASELGFFSLSLSEMFCNFLFLFQQRLLMFRRIIGSKEGAPDINICSVFSIKCAAVIASLECVIIPV